MIKILLIVSILLTTLCYAHNNCRILALSGGGAHGSFEVGVINHLDTMGYSWDIITGVSVGSINVGMLAMYLQNYIFHPPGEKYN